ncbi:hypothetical protein GCM10010301_73220 [Streptomyces plicatus]|nr:hypothetical protein GCM10010301_73220 [Streptomyces plicatus]
MLIGTDKYSITKLSKYRDYNRDYQNALIIKLSIFGISIGLKLFEVNKDPVCQIPCEFGTL